MGLSAKQLLDILSTHVAGTFLSQEGKRMYFPDGIVWQVEESAQAETKATAGIVVSKGSPSSLPCVAELLPRFTPKTSVAYAPVSGIKLLRDEWIKHIKEKKSFSRAI